MACERESEAKDAPASRGRNPLEHAVRHEVADVDDLIGRNAGLGRPAGAAVVQPVVVEGRREPCLLLGRRYASAGPQGELGDHGSRGGRRKRKRQHALVHRRQGGCGRRALEQQPKPRRCHWCEAAGSHRRLSGRQFGDRMPRPPVIAGFQSGEHRGRATEPSRTGEAQGDGRGRDRLVEPIRDPFAGAGCRVAGHRDPVCVGAIHELRHADGASRARRCARHQHPCLGRHGERHDVPTEDRVCGRRSPPGHVLVAAGDRGKVRQREADRTLGDGDLAPDQLLHRIRGLDPGCACRTPAGGGGDRELEAQAIGGLGCGTHGALPLCRTEDDALGDELGHVHAALEALGSTDADPLHPLEIEADSLLVDIAVHPVPPDPRSGSIRGLDEALPELVEGVGHWLTVAAMPWNGVAEPIDGANVQKSNAYVKVRRKSVGSKKSTSVGDLLHDPVGA